MSAPQLSLGPGERIVGFEVILRAARTVSLSNVSKEWSIWIDNSASEPKVRGNIIVGTAALDKNDFFTDFLVIEKDNSLGLRFDIKMEIITTVDFENEKRTVLEQKDLFLRKK